MNKRRRLCLVLGDQYYGRFDVGEGAFALLVRG
jgi:hypothetical protein